MSRRRGRINLSKLLFASVMSLTLVLAVAVAAVVAEEPTGSMISIISDWQGSVFGDVGGQDKITNENFEITENSDGTVRIRSSNNRGKIASGSEGIAYYFKPVPADMDFELTATATVESFAVNNQVSFGVMLRDTVLMNESRKEDLGSYLALGPINTAKDVAQVSFYRTAEGQVKLGDMQKEAVPGPGSAYELSLKRSGGIYILKFGSEEPVILDNFSAFEGKDIFAGLFTSRNATVTFSNVQLSIAGQVELGDWEFRAFGSNTGVEKNPPPAINADGSVRLLARGGKIASSEQGISFYYRELPAEANFTITAKAEVVEVKSSDKQVSFGLMLKDAVGEDGDSGKHNSNLVAVGALDKVIKAFYMKDKLTKLELDPVSPGPGAIYDLSIKKSGNTYVVTCNGTREIITEDSLFSDTTYAGLFAARSAEVIFSDFGIEVETRKVTELKVDTSMMKTEYLLHQSPNFGGLKVSAVYSDGSEELLSEDDYIITGFDSSTPGSNTITVNYGGMSAPIGLTINPLTCTALEVKYYPAKTEYYLGDIFDPEGLTVTAVYNDGYRRAELTPDKYVLSISGSDAEGFVFNKPGTEVVTITSVETPSTKTVFGVSVSRAAIVGLEIVNLPKKTLYFVGEELDLVGMTVYAAYSDGARVRLMRGDYNVSGFDSATPGTKEIQVSYKGKITSLQVVVKDRDLTGIELSGYPKTTYFVGESFDDAGLEISRVYDNGDREVLAKGEYTIDPSAFDKTKPGTYGIKVVPGDPAIAPVSFPVTVREKTECEWHITRFGQSTSESRNTVVVAEDGSVAIAAIDGGGKVATDHDGISFYYTTIDGTKDNFVLSADIKVIAYAKNPHDGQEAFGIMARDAIGEFGDSSVFASNMVGIGGFSGGTRNPIGTQLFARLGVESPDGAGSRGIQRIMLKEEKPQPDNTYPAAEYRLTLAKTNSGYVGRLNDGEEAIFFEPDLLNVQSPLVYVGFFAARVASIVVSNIEFSVTAAKTDPPKVEPPEEPVEPVLEFLSLDKTGDAHYNLVLKANINGSVTIKQERKTIARDASMTAGEEFTLPTILAVNSDTSFSVTFLPDDTQHLTSYDRMVRNFSVTVRTLAEGRDIYVSPAGRVDGTGSEADPVDLDTAISFVRAGQRIILLDGTYARNSKLEIRKYNDGTPTEKKHMLAAPGARPAVDFGRRSEGVILSGNHWHIKGIDFTNSAGNTKGFVIGGSHNTIEDCRFYGNGDTGLQISRTDIFEEDRSKWPSHNLVLNCESFDNRDPSDNNADGFAAKLTCGEGNVFRGCIAHNNIDDGWDLYTKAGTGAIGAVVIDRCIACNNGFLTDGTPGGGDKNGFKLGGEGIHVPHLIRNSLAFGNGAAGFTSNSNPGVIARNNLAYDNKGGNLIFTTYPNITPDFTIDGFVSHQLEGAPKDSYPAEEASESNYFFNGFVSKNKTGAVLSGEDFIDRLLKFAVTMQQRE